MAKAKPSTKKRATKRKRSSTSKPTASRKGTTSKRTTAKKRTTKKNTATRPKATKKTTRPTVRKQSPRTAAKSKSDFNFNKWLLPTLALEQYEPDIAEEVGVEDNIAGSTRYAWIGAGQCGGRLVKSFYDLGYRKALAVNTTNNDLNLLDIPKSQKFLMDIGEKGAGKDMERGKEAVQQYAQDIVHLAKKTFGTQVDHIMVCFGAGGGTGSGSVLGLIEIAKKYARYIGLENPDRKVGVVMTLPTVGEANSPLVAKNSWNVATQLSQLASKGQISPLVIVDNDKINRMYPGMTVRSFWPNINSTFASLFDIFNGLSAMSSRYTSFDPVDYHSIMESGGCSIMGLTKVDKFSDKFELSKAVKTNLEKTLLAGGFDLSTAKLAGCMFVGGKKMMLNTKGLQDNIDYAFDVLSEITGRATIHRGIYEDARESLRAYTIIGGLDSPVARLEEFKSGVAVGAH
jgi:cell division GTPase FtsZ